MFGMYRILINMNRVFNITCLSVKIFVNCRHYTVSNKILIHFQNFEHNNCIRHYIFGSIQGYRFSLLDIGLPQVTSQYPALRFPEQSGLFPFLGRWFMGLKEQKSKTLQSYSQNWLQKYSNISLNKNAMAKELAN